MKHILRLSMSLLLLNIAQSQYIYRLQDSTTTMFVNTALGISFEYESLVDFIDTSYPIALDNWNRYTKNPLRVSFRSPEPYELRWKQRDFWLWKPAADSGLFLDYGEGATVWIYQTTRSFAEIAFAEGFKQYQGDTIEPFPVSDWDTLAFQPSDTNWIFVGLSGMGAEAQLLNGIRWKGLRVQSDTRVALPEQSTTCMAPAYISFLMCARPEGDNIVFAYRMYPDGNGGDTTDQKAQRLSEAGFYDLVASVKFAR